MKRVLLLGATGSIGKNAVAIALQYSDIFQIITVVANTQAIELADIAKKVQAKYAVINNPAYYQELKNALSNTNIIPLAGEAGLQEILSMQYDLTIAAIVGAAGIYATYHSIACSTTVAIANKESMVCAGELLKSHAAKHNTMLVPIDSEHTALSQILEPEGLTDVTITASGGALRNSTYEELKHATCDAALNHPNWQMGKKITIDSATLANKGLEVIEAMQFFNLRKEQIQVVVHPQSIVHAMTHYHDGTSIAHLGYPDMKTAIAYAMHYPHRLALPVPRLDLINIARLDFQEVDHKRFPMLQLAFSIADSDIATRTVFNIANEIAVEAFLKGSANFYDISDFTAHALATWPTFAIKSLDDLLDYINHLNSNCYKKVA